MRDENYLELISGYITSYSDNIEINFLTDTILEIRLENNDYFYIIYESLKVYISSKTAISFIEDLNSIEFKSSNFLRIPFFAGCSGYDIGNFLYGKNQTISENLDNKIFFEVPVADFNILGLKRFLNYMEIQKNLPPIFNGNNNYSEYLQYFLDKINSSKSYNEVMPLKELQKLYPDNGFIKEIHELLLENLNEYKGQ